MPRLTVWMVRTALLQLGVGFTFGMLILFNKGIPFDPSVWRFVPAHIEMVLRGWTILVGMGVACWVVPRFSTSPRYGREQFGWLAYVLFNIGTLIFILSIWADVVWLPFAGRALELMAVVSFILMIWPRVKALGLSSG